MNYDQGVQSVLLLTDLLDNLQSLSTVYINVSKGAEIDRDKTEPTLELLEELMKEMTEKIAASKEELLYGKRQPKL